MLTAKPQTLNPESDGKPTVTISLQVNIMATITAPLT